MTTSPIPVEQFGTWLSEFVASLQTLGDENAVAETPTSQLSPFQAGPAKLLHSIAHGLHGPITTTAHPLHINDSQTARAAVRLRDQFIHNLGST
jgi:hypothetical protein